MKTEIELLAEIATTLQSIETRMGITINTLESIKQQEFDYWEVWKKAKEKEES